MQNHNKTLNFAIIDPHIHQWDPYTTPHAAQHLVKYLGNYPRLMDKVMRLVKSKALLATLGTTAYALDAYLPQDYKKDTEHFHVESVVHIEANWHDQKGYGVVNETRWIQGLDFQTQDIKLGAIIATADPRQKNFKHILDLHQQASPLFRGIRKMASYHQDKGIYRWCEQDKLYRNKKFLVGFEEIAKRGLVFDAWCYSTQLDDVIYLAQQFPSTPIILDHLGTPAGIFGAVGRHTGKTAAERQRILHHWQNKIALLAEYQNVHSKISGLMMPVLGHQYHQQQRFAPVAEMIDLLQPLIHHAINMFGTERILFASNFPMDKASAQFVDIVTAYLHILEPYGDNALFQIFRHNAQQIYRIEI